MWQVFDLEFEWRQLTEQGKKVKISVFFVVQLFLKKKKKNLLDSSAERGVFRASSFRKQLCFHNVRGIYWNQDYLIYNRRASKEKEKQTENRLWFRLDLTNLETVMMISNVFQINVKHRNEHVEKVAWKRILTFAFHWKLIVLRETNQRTGVESWPILQLLR